MHDDQLRLSLMDATRARPGAANDLELGEVFTRRWVVDLILDLVGYTVDQDLASLRAIEPACGEGAFLGPIIDRLIASAERYARSGRTISPTR